MKHQTHIFINSPWAQLSASLWDMGASLSHAGHPAERVCSWWQLVVYSMLSDIKGDNTSISLFIREIIAIDSVGETDTISRHTLGTRIQCWLVIILWTASSSRCHDKGDDHVLYLLFWVYCFKLSICQALCVVVSIELFSLAFILTINGLHTNIVVPKKKKRAKRITEYLTCTY